jgi:hypothetical protein
VRRLLALAACTACTKEPSPCARQVEMLRGWLGDVALDGPPAPVQHGIHLVALPDSQRTAPPRAAHLVMHPDELAFEGRLIANGRWTDPAPLAAELKAAARDELVVIADASIPWSEIATVAATAERAGVHRLVFVFRFAVHADPPPGSSAGGDGALGSAVLEQTQLLDHVLGRCPAARALSRDDVRAFTDQLAPAIAACNCAVELPAVKRLVWTAWGRDNPETVQTTRTVAIASNGTPISLPAATPWDGAVLRVITVARAGAVHLTSDR